MPSRKHPALSNRRTATHSYFHDIRAAKEATIRHGPVRGDDSGSGEIGHYAAATKAVADRPQLRFKQRPRVISMVICYSCVRRLSPLLARTRGVCGLAGADFCVLIPRRAEHCPPGRLKERNDDNNV